MKKLLLVFSILLMVGIFGQSEAAIMQYDGFSDFYSVNQASNDFESVIDTTYFNFDDTASLIHKDIATGGVTSSGDYGLVEYRSDEPLTCILSQAAYEVGMFFGNVNWGAFDAVLEVYDAGNALLGNVSVTANINDWADQFIGLSSDVAFNRVDIRYTRPGAEYLAVFIDDFTVGFDAAPVPEPATMLLLGAGLLGLVGLGRKKLFKS